MIKVIERLKQQDYLIRIIYIFLDSPSDCIERIKVRVKLGGHFVPDEDVIRRFYRSIDNFWNVYKYLINEWILYYNSTTFDSSLVAMGENNNYLIENNELFEKFIAHIKNGS